MISTIVFALLLVAAVGFFAYNVRKISRNIKLGKDIDRTDNPVKRWFLMFKVAVFQSKMMGLPVAGIFHLFVYGGFILVNIEMIEVMVDGFAGTHRAFSFLGSFYPVIITAVEFFALLVIIGCTVFLFRRNVLRLPRFWKPEMTSWPRLDANIILITEVILMTSVFFLNASDYVLQTREYGHYKQVGSFFLSSFFVPLVQNLPSETLVIIDRTCWWLHIVGIMVFLNYIPYSKHFHVFLSFPNVYFSKLEPAGKIANMPSITREIKSMLGKPVEPEENVDMSTMAFGAKDVKELTWKHLMDAYSCTECGRCTRVCPANITGKKLSPRKLIMDARDRLEIVGKNIDKNGKDFIDEKSLFDFISAEELWACTTCNACTNACPVNIDQVSLIIELRRHLVMEKAAAPGELNAIFSNIENNGAPWQFSQQDRMLWANELYINEKA
ncbi:MAG: (Fe-S)-binding protein [Bacteroidales bacterium]|jgi:heterodisulfide reductase subunit C|nr:(Fe-S)-binding protein [Bacteroidales bacterium]